MSRYNVYFKCVFDLGAFQIDKYDDLLQVRTT